MARRRVVDKRQRNLPGSLPSKAEAESVLQTALAKEDELEERVAAKKRELDELQRQLTVAGDERRGAEYVWQMTIQGEQQGMELHDGGGG